MPEPDTSFDPRIHLTKTMALLALVTLSLLVPVFASLLYYDNAFLDGIDHMPGAFMLLAVAGVLVGIVVEFMNVWLTRRFEFGAILGTTTAILVAAFVAIPVEGGPIAFISLGCGGAILLLLTIPFRHIPANRRPKLDATSEPIPNHGPSNPPRS